MLLLLPLQEFDPDCIRDFLNQLTPARARITHASRVHEQQQTPDGASSLDPYCLPAPALTSEPIYGTQYDVQPLPRAWLDAWSNGAPIEGLHLPDVNPFVPDDLSLAAAEGPREGLPDVLLEEGGVRLWQRTDLRFENPKATIVLDFQVGGHGCGLQGVRNWGGDPEAFSVHPLGFLMNGGGARVYACMGCGCGSGLTRGIPIPPLCSTSRWVIARLVAACKCVCLCLCAAT
jgi:hypothetical protein